MIRYVIAGADVVDEHPDGKWVLEKDARAEIARLGRELNLAKYGEPDFSWSIHKEAMSELLARAVKAEAERDEARAQVAAAFEAASDVLFDHGDGTVEIALDKRLCCNGYQCGCQGATVGLYLQHLIRAFTPADAKAALEAYGREKVREGVKRAASLFKDANHGKHIMDAILAEMETLK